MASRVGSRCARGRHFDGAARASRLALVFVVVASRLTEAQPDCTATALTPIPVELIGQGMLTAVPALHARWAGALLSVNSRSVEVLASSDGLVLDRMCIDAVTAKNGGTEWDLKGYTCVPFALRAGTLAARVLSRRGCSRGTSAMPPITSHAPPSRRAGTSPSRCLGQRHAIQAHIKRAWARD